MSVASEPHPAAAVDTLTGPPSKSRRILAFGRRNELATAGALFFMLVLFCSIFAPWLTSYAPDVIDIPSRLQSPSWAHPFGTDEFGRDLLTRVFYGGRPILLIGIASVAGAMLIGTLIGMIAGYVGGRTDNLLMRLMDIMLSFPAILLAILIVAALGAGVTNAIIAIAFSMIPTFARLARSIVMLLTLDLYVLAARSIGANHRWILRRHIFPNMIPPIIVQATAMLAIAISYSAALSFIGLGVEPPMADWGLMVSEGQRLIFDAAWVPFFPGLAITLTVLAVNYVGDGLRDHLDPTMKNR